MFANPKFQTLPTSDHTRFLLKVPPNIRFKYFFSDRMQSQDPIDVGNQTQGVLLNPNEFHDVCLNETSTSHLRCIVASIVLLKLLELFSFNI
jgi:hypothetical protein